MLESATDRQTWPLRITPSPSRISKTIPEFQAKNPFWTSQTLLAYRRQQFLCDSAPTFREQRFTA